MHERCPQVLLGEVSDIVLNQMRQQRSLTPGCARYPGQEIAVPNSLHSTPRKATNSPSEKITSASFLRSLLNARKENCLTNNLPIDFWGGVKSSLQQCFSTSINSKLIHCDFPEWSTLKRPPFSSFQPYPTQKAQPVLSRTLCYVVYLTLLINTTFSLWVHHWTWSNGQNFFRNPTYWFDQKNFIWTTFTNQYFTHKIEINRKILRIVESLSPTVLINRLAVFDLSATLAPRAGRPPMQNTPTWAYISNKVATQNHNPQSQVKFIQRLNHTYI